MELHEKLWKIIDKSGRGYLDHNMYIARLWNEIFADEVSPEMVEKIGYFTFFVLALDSYSGSPVEMSADELPSIIKGDYSIQAYKNRLANLDDSKYSPSRDWLIGMIKQLEREESERGQSEV